MLCYKYFIKNSIREINVLSRLYKIDIPYAFIYKNKGNYTKKDFDADINKVICFKKHPMILRHLPKY